MKYFIIWTVALLVQLNTNAQINNFKNGIISYAVTTSINENTKESVLLKSTYEIVIQDSKFRSDNVNNFGKESEIFDSKNGNGCILKEYSRQKIMMAINEDQWQKKQYWYNNLHFTLFDDTINIMGYICKRATAIIDSNKLIELYYCPSIIIKPEHNKLGNENIKGLVIKSTFINGKNYETHILTSLQNKHMNLQYFNQPQSGYRILQYNTNSNIDLLK